MLIMKNRQLNNDKARGMEKRFPGVWDSGSYIHERDGLRSMRSCVSFKDVLVKDGPLLWRWSPKSLMELKSSYCLVTL